jgi:predicted nucleotidyltransferase
MKKVLWLALVLTLALVMLAGCGEAPAEEAPVDEAPEEEVVETGTSRLGLGVVTSIARSRDAGDEVNAQAQADVVMAAVLFDAEGRVVSVTIDNAQTRVPFDEEMQVDTDTTVPGKTKAELGDDYGMKRVSEIEMEWYEQMAEFENWMLGKTVDEIKSLQVKVVDDAHQNVPDIPELTSVVTITVEGYIEAVENAYNNSIEVENAATAGLGTEISIARSRGLDEAADVLPMAQIDNTMAAVAFDADGVIVGAIIDNAQIRINFDAEGMVTSDRSEAPKTKVQLGDDYGMKRVSEIEMEWYEQMAEFENWMVGKTVAEVLGLQVKVVDDAHQFVPDIPELTSTVTITVESYQAVVAKAFDNAR